MKNVLPTPAEGAQGSFLDEIRTKARADALSRGYTLEEQIDALERAAGVPKGALDSYRVLYGILPLKLN